jgi:hypothetical protein
MKYCGYPSLTPNKPERLVTHCPDCDGELAINDGNVAECVSERCKATRAPAA